MKTNVLNQVPKSVSKRVSSQSDIEVPKSGRKSSVKAKKTCEGEGIDPHQSDISLLSFLPIFGIYGSFREFFVRSVGGRTGFTSDYFVLFMCVAVGVSVVHRRKRVGRGGVSVSYLVGVIYNSVNSSLLRGVNYKLSLMVESGLLVRNRSVGSFGMCYLYSISIHAEKLLLSKISKKELLGLNGLVRSML